MAPIYPTTSPDTNGAETFSDAASPSISKSAMAERISEIWNHTISHSRPWRDLVDPSSFAKPESMADAGVRIRKNLAYFRLNYIIIFSAILALSIVTNPIALFLLSGVCAAWIFGYITRSFPLTIFDRTYSERNVLLLLCVMTAVVLLLTDVGSLLLSTAMLGFFIICVHAVFHVPSDLPLDGEPSVAGVAYSVVPPSRSPQQDPAAFIYV